MSQANDYISSLHHKDLIEKDKRIPNIQEVLSSSINQEKVQELKGKEILVNEIKEYQEKCELYLATKPISSFPRIK
ncbi:12416_t:CDS:2 [Entrophospora sp. SA101]|nr:15072_t:CDS:2 [Entrophospora sp. SA101]CAJ0762703.1 12416_t:CDS:2 [Entrophospora sp. SA101]CAJ0847233.1 7819_t:CDS:2 [Entrophospora sp. SA101]